MPTRNINLTDRYDAFLAEQIASGRFKNVSEAVRAALHLLERQDLEEEAKLEALRREVRIGIDAYEAGAYTEIADADCLDAFFVSLDTDADNSANPDTPGER
ncbi:MAG: type II toxin-antitoxin system ParD family antitoxin [Pseudomonadota bacterium]